MLYKKEKIEQTIFNENNRYFMILFVTLKVAYTYFSLRRYFPYISGRFTVQTNYYLSY